MIDRRKLVKIALKLINDFNQTKSEFWKQPLSRTNNNSIWHEISFRYFQSKLYKDAVRVQKYFQRNKREIQKEMNKEVVHPILISTNKTNKHPTQQIQVILKESEWLKIFEECVLKSRGNRCKFGVKFDDILSEKLQAKGNL